jgi:hypothetical protein
MLASHPTRRTDITNNRRFKTNIKVLFLMGKVDKYPVRIYI